VVCRVCGMETGTEDYRDQIEKMKDAVWVWDQENAT
jgi:hypothetical protein